MINASLLDLCTVMIGDRDEKMHRNYYIYFVSLLGGGAWDLRVRTVGIFFVWQPKAACGLITIWCNRFGSWSVIGNRRQSCHVKISAICVRSFVDPLPGLYFHIGCCILYHWNTLSVSSRSLQYLENTRRLAILNPSHYYSLFTAAPAKTNIIM